MEREDLFDIDVETVICKYISGSEALPNVKYVEGVTYDALLNNYYKIKKAYIDKIQKEKVEIAPKDVAEEIVKNYDKIVKNMDYNFGKIKPPLGVKPCFIQAEERIKDLADAISRYANRGDYETIKRWAREICLQCDIAGMEKND